MVKIVFYASEKGVGVGVGDITNQCAVGELKWCELIHAFRLQLILNLHTMELQIIPIILHLVQCVSVEWM